MDDRERFLSDIKSDKSPFESILDELDSLNLMSHDPKAEALIDNIKNVLSQKTQGNEPNRNVVVFSEYTDTVKYLAPILASKSR